MEIDKIERFILKDFSASNSDVSIYFNLKEIEKRMIFLKSLQTKNIYFLFPVKSFPAKEVLDIASTYLDGYDISNQAELELVQSYEDKFIHNSAPYLKVIPPNHEHKIDITYDINSIENIQEALSKKIKISLRVNSDFIFNNNSRFGIEPEVVSELLNKFQNINSIHIHLSSEVNTFEQYIKMINFCDETAKKLTSERQLRFNLGGGFTFLSNQEISNILELASTKLKNHLTYFEPGRWISSKSGIAIGKVLDIHKTKSKSLIVTSISPTCHLRWQTTDIKITIANEKNILKETHTNITYAGPTCFEKDIIQVPNKTSASIGIGSLCIVKYISGYSYGWNHSFNGIAKADIKFIS